MSAPRRVIGPSPPGRLPAAMLRALTAELSDPGRFSRAKAYARDGAVVDIEVQPGEVRVEILGSRYEPYQTRVWSTPAEDRTSPVGLVPERDELGAECTCPDDAPYAFCKHALAALLVLADEVTIDPDVLATWRSGTAVARPVRDQAAPGSLSALVRAPAAIPEPPRLPPRLPVAMPATSDELAAAAALRRLTCLTAAGTTDRTARRRRRCRRLGNDWRSCSRRSAASCQALSNIIKCMNSNVRTIVDRSGPPFVPACATIDTPVRLLRLLVLFSSRSTWSAQELVDRLEVTPRTLRRDVTRLRDLGYPIVSTTGRYGGYALGAGGRLPPLLLDDDEAVAVSVALLDFSRSADPTLGEAAVAALTKLAQVLPSALRERVDTLGEVSVRLGRAGDPVGDVTTDVSVLMALAQACRRQDRLRFDYTTGDDRVSRRHVEPHRLVSVRSRWYLVAFDLDRDDWRTFRVDRVGPPAPTGARNAERESPDAAALVAEGVAVRVYETQVLVRVHASPDRVAREIAPTIGVIETGPADAVTTLVRLGGDADWLARYLASLPFRFEVLDSDDVRRELTVLAEQLTTAAATS